MGCKTVFSASCYYPDESVAAVAIMDSNLKVMKGEQWREPYFIRPEEKGDLEEEGSLHSGVNEDEKRRAEDVGIKVGVHVYVKRDFTADNDESCELLNLFNGQRG